MSTVRARSYVPALQYDWALPLFVPLVRVLGLDWDLREAVHHARLTPGQHLLDVGCGPGILPLLAKQLQPAAHVTGLDPDPLALARGRRSAARAGLEVRWDQGFSDDLPYASGSFDHVTSTFMFHHLNEDEKARTLLEVRRVLKRGGLFHLVDFGQRRAGSLRARVFPRGDVYRDGIDPFADVIAAAGFAEVELVGTRRVPLIGRVSYYQAR
jgi:ubiquinone/menaquinone biosynthesis C-methylase UbiE